MIITIPNYQNEWMAVKRKMKGERKNRGGRKERPIFHPFLRGDGAKREKLFYPGPDIRLPNQGDADEPPDLQGIRIFEGELAFVGLAFTRIVNEPSVP